jgi:hypothetical protein
MKTEATEEQYEQRFWSYVDKKNEDECWTWQGTKSGCGYGYFSYRNADIGAHRMSLQFKLGRPIIMGMHACHDCNNRHCVNPSHLREDTASSNVKDLVRAGNHNNARKTHCKHGHEFTPDNVYINKNKRYCIACRGQYANRRS